jgi:hypothetical protein
VWPLLAQSRIHHEKLFPSRLRLALITVATIHPRFQALEQRLDNLGINQGIMLSSLNAS